ncbi:S-layer homology domain-containing protein [Paenibacillus lycopersici]|nr:S-layer homology domain-containing protein [Paenibacillus lycopersici]
MLAASLGLTALPVGALHANAASVKLTDEAIQQAIDALADYHVLQGYEDGSTAVRNPVSRAELAKMVVMTFNRQDKVQSPAGFTDIKPGAWYYPYAAELVEAGIMQAVDGTFNPKGSVSDPGAMNSSMRLRAQAAATAEPSSLQTTARRGS